MRRITALKPSPTINADIGDRHGNTDHDNGR
jgi:hypothetical protein